MLATQTGRHSLSIAANDFRPYLLYFSVHYPGRDGASAQTSQTAAHPQPSDGHDGRPVSHTQLLDHSAHRPRQVHPGGQASGAHRHARAQPDAGAGAGQHGPGARARHHHQGPRHPHELHGQGRAGVRAQSHRHAGACGLRVRGFPQSGRLRGCDPGRRRRAGR